MNSDYTRCGVTTDEDTDGYMSSVSRKSVNTTTSTAKNAKKKRIKLETFAFPQDNLNGTLSSFRIKWKQELDSISNVKNVDDSGDKDQVKAKQKGDKAKHVSIETKAKLLFHQGTEYEQSGKYYDAIQCYKNAMQLVPDIEFRIYSELKYEQSGKYYDAIQCYKNAMQLVPDIEFRIYSESKQARTLRQEVSSETPEAKLLFHQGTEYEQSGKYYDAIQCYKNAMQLVPDIEFRIYSESKQARTLRQEVSSETPEVNGFEEVPSGGEDSNEEEEDEYDGSEDLLVRCQRLLCKHNTFILPAHPQTATHFSALPMEIVIYILRWVMSQHHDARSIDMCSRVCRGMHRFFPGGLVLLLTTADVPSSVVGSLKWRTPRDSTKSICWTSCVYTVHVCVEASYKSILKFFPGGLVLLLTTADVPSSVVGSLKWRTPRDSTILIGHYKMRGDRVFIVAKQSRYNLANARVKTRNRRVNEYETRDQTFHLELKIDTHRHKRNVCLQWQDYSISRTNYLGDTNTDNFDTLGSKFPPFWFSRVKSYTAESDGILEVNF
ncbi:F-box only protein 9-like [Diaphorina citri]|uniref:F-box only protein 9-like n=1 Tax=Diaphorina citri TaxID=121845 RepID=A0A3Q0IQV3_DIACI|nr:F-box only protein 9-like [Diaphorina citri]